MAPYKTWGLYWIWVGSGSEGEEDWRKENSRQEDLHQQKLMEVQGVLGWVSG